MVPDLWWMMMMFETEPKSSSSISFRMRSGHQGGGEIVFDQQGAVHSAGPRHHHACVCLEVAQGGQGARESDPKPPPQ